LIAPALIILALFFGKWGCSVLHLPSEEKKSNKHFKTCRSQMKNWDHLLPPIN
ncbi:hypothetical protein NQ317_006978, partial [Molorchus minor]